jgi:hypothetical protein
MSVTRHWIARVRIGNAIGEREHVIRDEAAAELHRAAGWQIEGPFVPERPQGAVKRAEQYEALIREMLRDEPVRRRWENRALALVEHHAGGQ